MSDPVGIGVAGYGYWGPNLVRNFAEAEGSRLVAVCDANPKRLAAARRRYPGVRCFTDYGDMLRDPEIHAVAIATPVHTHYRLSRLALEAERHVLVEKPMAATLAEGQELIELARKRGRVLMVDHTFIYTGAVRKIRDMVAAGELGEVFYYDGVRINLGLFQHDVNVLWDLAIHDLSIMEFVLGREAVSVSATGVSHLNGQPENIAYLTLFFGNNLIAHLHVNWLAPVKIRRTLIAGSRRMIVYDDLEPSEKVRVYDTGVDYVQSPPEAVYQMLISYRTGDVWIPKLDMAEALAVEARHFIECIRTGHPPLSGGETGLRMIRILEAASQSMAEQGRLIQLKPA
jgi:predicted dehydrogenase